MPNKNLGQHWLKSEYLGEILDTIDLRAGDHVLEIGPGPGNLTEMLLSTGANVTAVEIDPDLYEKLKIFSAKFYSRDRSRLHLFNQDILKFDLMNLPPGYKVVANIPYYLTGKILRLLTESANPPAEMTILVQKEVAERLAAQPGSLSVIAIVVQLFGEIELGAVIPAAAFTPPPKVDSQIVHITRRIRPRFADLDVKSFMRIVKAGFGERRKKLRSSLAGGLHLTKEQTDAWLRQSNIVPGARAQELSLRQWYELWKNQPI